MSAGDRKAYQKAWYQANRERKAATTKAWYEANRERKAATTKAWVKHAKVPA